MLLNAVNTTYCIPEDGYDFILVLFSQGSHADLRALFHKSQTLQLDDATKEKVWPVLTVHFMCSEEPNAEDVPTEQEPVSSHENDQEQSKRKKH